MKNRSELPPSDTAMLEWLDQHTLPKYTAAVVFTFAFRFKQPFENRPTLIEAIQRAMSEEGGGREAVNSEPRLSPIEHRSATGDRGGSDVR